MGWRPWISFLAVVACGPGASTTTDAETSSTSGGVASSSDTAGTPADTIAETTSVTDASSTDAADSSTGEPTEPALELCWTSTWARAEGVSRAWTDGEAVIAAAGESLLLLDEDDWREEHLEGVRVSGVAARFPTDAWLLAQDSVLHWDGVTASVDLAVPGATMQTFGLSADGVVWVAYAPADDCVDLCDIPPSEVQIRGGDGTWLMLEPPGIVASALVFTETSTWLGGQSGELLRRDGYDQPWIAVETPMIGDIQRMWPFGDGLLVTADDAWRYMDDAWALQIEQGFFSGVTGFARSAGREQYLLYSEHVAAELDHTGELRRLAQEGQWLPTTTLEANRDLVALGDGRLVAFGDERGHLVQTIDDPRGAPVVTTVLQRADVGDTTAFAITGDGALVGVDETAIQIEGADAWTSADDNSIYGNFGAAGGPSTEDLTLVSADGPPLWHFDGEALSPIPFTQPEDATINLTDLWVADDGAMFAAGRRTGVLGWPVDPAVLRFDGEAWVESPAPDAPCEGACLGEIEGHGDQRFLAGHGVWEWAADAWVDIRPFPDQPFTFYGSLAVGPHGAWVIASTEDGPRLMQRSGGAWIDHTDALPVVVDEDEYRGLIVVDDDTHVWVAWGESLSRFDGSAWTEVASPESGPWSASAMIVAPGARLVVHTQRRIWSGVACGG
jgi:hypothetical protein